MNKAIVMKDEIIEYRIKGKTLLLIGFIYKKALKHA